MRLRKVLIIYKKSSYQTIHRETFGSVKAGLDRLKIPYDVRLRHHLRPIRHYDLTVTVGGDGTFLEASHYLDRGLILGVNSVPKESVGFFCRATAANFLEKIHRCLKGTFRVQRLHRLEVTLDGKRTGPLALNDILFTNRNPAGMSRYLLKVGRTHEEQKSSGLWISPAPGSTAAVRSAGGRKLPVGSRKIQYVVREPYTPKGRKYRLLRGILALNQPVTIVPLREDAALYIDGPHFFHPVRRGQTIVIRNAHHPIRAVW